MNQNQHFNSYIEEYIFVDSSTIFYILNIKVWRFEPSFFFPPLIIIWKMVALSRCSILYRRDKYIKKKKEVEKIARKKSIINNHYNKIIYCMCCYYFSHLILHFKLKFAIAYRIYEASSGSVIYNESDYYNNYYYDNDPFFANMLEIIREKK